MIEIRKVVQGTEERWHEGGPRLEAPRVVAYAGVVIANPLAGQYMEDLGEWRDAVAPHLGELLASRLHALLDGRIEAYGKGVIVGIDGELESGSAIIHTLQFGNPLRRLANGRSLLPAVEKVGPPGAVFDIPLKHVIDDSTRSHHQTLSLSIPDAPLPREFLVVLAGASGGRAHARIGAIADER